jgi:hemoglobin
MRIDRISKAGIQRLVDAFYAKVRADPELGQIVNRAVSGGWGRHPATMRDFWSSVMLTNREFGTIDRAISLSAR